MHFVDFLIVEFHVVVPDIGHSGLSSVSKIRRCVVDKRTYLPSAVSGVPALPAILLDSLGMMLALLVRLTLALLFPTVGEVA